MSEIKRSETRMTNPAGTRNAERMVPPGNNMDVNSVVNICSILRQRPHAVAAMRGSNQYPEIRGRVMFYQMRMGVLVAAEIFGLPRTDMSSMGGMSQTVPGTMPQSVSGIMPQPAPGTVPQTMQGQNRPVMPGSMSQTVPGTMPQSMSGNQPQSTPGPAAQPQMSDFGSTMMTTRCQNPVFGFHIHSGSSCTGNAQDPFADAGEHYNPGTCLHPYHAGDMPPLFGNNGYAFQIFLTDRFRVSEIIGKTVIIHGSPDDFMTQPGGNSGTRIACGPILGRNV